MRVRPCFPIAPHSTSVVSYTAVPIRNFVYVDCTPEFVIPARVDLVLRIIQQMDLIICVLILPTGELIPQGSQMLYCCCEGYCPHRHADNIHRRICAKLRRLLLIGETSRELSTYPTPIIYLVQRYSSSVVPPQHYLTCLNPQQASFSEKEFEKRPGLRGSGISAVALGRSLPFHFLPLAPSLPPSRRFIASEFSSSAPLPAIVPIHSSDVCSKLNI